MGLNGLLDKIQARIELFRLEQRYTRNRNRRSTFISNAVYVDGEYIYNTPTNTGSSSSSDDANTAAAPNATAITTPAGGKPISLRTAIGIAEQKKRDTKRLNRWSSMPGFGSLGSGGASANQMAEERAAEWHSKRASMGPSFR